MYSFPWLWRNYFAPFFKDHRAMYAGYIIIILFFYLIQALVMPRVISNYSKDPVKNWFRAPVFRRFTPLIVVFLVMIIMVYVKNRMDAILPTMHYQWLRDKMFSDMIWTYREKNTTIPVGVFMMRYNLLPQEIRVIFEDALETLPAVLSLLYLFIYFCTFDVKIGVVYLVLYGAVITYLLFSPSSRACQRAVEKRARENLDANDTASQEVLNLGHIYANQVEAEHIKNQSEAEKTLQKKWEGAQKTINNLLIQVNLMSLLIYGIMLALFYHHFKRGGNMKYWPAVFLILTFAQTTLMGTLPRWLGLINGFTMVKIYHEAVMSDTTSAVVSTPTPGFKGTDDYTIVIDDISLELGGKQIFSSFSASIPQGQKILVQGASGSGKSSLFNMLTRYVSTYTGVIRIGGTDIREWDLDALRTAVVSTPQQTQLFDKSILYNICVDECSDEQKTRVSEIVRRFGWHSILGDNLEKKCGPMGKNVSHGMQKLIVLLRLMWKSRNARVVLVDEPLASLDATTQDQILRFLVEVSAGKTLIVNNHVPLSPDQRRMFDQVWDSSSFRK